MNIKFACESEEDRQFLAAAEAHGFGPAQIVGLLYYVFEGLKKGVASGMTYTDLQGFQRETLPTGRTAHVRLVKRIKILRDARGELAGSEDYVPDPEPFWIKSSRAFRDMSPSERFVHRVNMARGRASV